MAEAADTRDSDNNWVIANNEGYPVETLGAAETETPAVPEASPTPGSDSGHKDEEFHDSPSHEGAKEAQTLSPLNSSLALDQQVDMPPVESGSAPEDTEQHLYKLSSGLSSRVERCVGTLVQYLPDTLKSWGQRSVSGTDEELEEVSCSSSEDDAEGLRKRIVRGSPPVSVGASPKEAVEQEDDGGFGLTLNKCIIAALALIGIGFLALSGGFSADEDTPEMVIARSVSGEDEPPQAIVDIQEWMNKHATQFSGDPGSFKVISDLLDKVAKENQDIRHMQAKLQAQKEELESILKISEGETVSAAPQDERLSDENLRLKEALLKEETAHLSAKEELQSLREKMETLEPSSLEGQQLVSENTKLKEELDASRNQIESFLSQKETLLAEALMLRQELDKQRSLVGTLRRDLESLIAQKSSPEVDEQQLQGKISDISNQLALEVQRSETWEKTYVEHAEKRKSQVGDHSPKEWKKAEKHGRTHNFSASGGEFRKHRKDHGERPTEGEVRESQHEEWKSRKHEHHEEQREQSWHKKKHRHWEGEKHGADHQATGNGTVKEYEKKHEHRHSDSTQHHHENQERGWKDKHSKHHHGEEGGGFHPRKGQKDFLHSATEDEDNRKHKEQGDKPHPKESHHKHHDHNKFWKKLSDHQYRIPEGCSGVEDCARKDGIDLFNVELKPVQRKQFEDILHSYLAKTNFSKHLPGLVPLLDGFFEGHVFAHDKVRFRDFVDDVEDFLEDLAKKETGSDDAVDDFEKYVYTHFFGEAAKKKKRFAKKEAHKTNGTNEDHWKKSSAHEPHHYPKKDHRNKEFKVERSPTEDPRSPDHKPPRKEYHKNDVHHHRDEHRPPSQYSHHKDHNKYEREGPQNYKPDKYQANKPKDQHEHRKFNPEHEGADGLPLPVMVGMSNFKGEHHQRSPKPYKSEHEKKGGYVHKHKKYESNDGEKDWSHSHHKNSNPKEKGHDTSDKHGEWKSKSKHYGEVAPKPKDTSPYPQDERDGKPHHKHEHKPSKQKYEKETSNDRYESRGHRHPYEKSEGKKPSKEGNRDRAPNDFYNQYRKSNQHYPPNAKHTQDRDQSHREDPKQKRPKENQHGHKHNRDDGDGLRHIGRDHKAREHW